MAADGLTPKQERFVAEYLAEPNATKAAKAAGYSERSAYSQGQRLLKNAEVAEAIAVGQRAFVKPTIATAEQRREFWSGVMNSQEVQMKDRLRASELLGKSQGDFIENVNLRAGVELEVVEEIVDAKPPTPESA